MTSVYITGSGAFAAAAAEHLTHAGHRIAGAACPPTGRRGRRRDQLGAWAADRGLPVTVVDNLRPDHVPDGVDLILAAHSHAFLGKRTRARAPVALGYHPSLLPLHRGRDAVKWQARLGERVVGGSIYHLTDRVDGGPLHDQRHVIVPDGIDHRALWREHLFPLGLEMVVSAAAAVQVGSVRYAPQDDRLATWEPSLDAAPVYRPEVLELGPPRP